MPTPVDIGAVEGAATTHTDCTLTTTATVPVGAYVLLGTYMNDNRAISSITGDNGLTWTKLVELAISGGSVSIWGAPAPSGLVSGATIISNYASGNLRDLLVAAYVEDLDALPADQTQTFSATAQAAWDTGTTGTRTTATQLSFAVAGEADSAATTSTTDAPATKLHDFDGVNNRCITTSYENHTSAGASRITGTFSTSAGAVRGAIVTLKVGGAGPPPPDGIYRGVRMKGATSKYA